MKTMLFDLGNVLLRFSHERMCCQLAELFETTPAAMQEQVLQQQRYARFDLGEISEDEFQQQLEAEFSLTVSRSALQQATGDIFEPIPGMQEFVSQIRSQGLRLVLLSNTCSTHIDWIRQQYALLDHFHDLVLSYEVRLAKPDPAIYELVLERIDCAPADCFYTDDIPDYVTAARAFGIQAEVFTGPTAFREHLHQRGITLAPPVEGG